MPEPLTTYIQNVVDAFTACGVEMFQYRSDLYNLRTQLIAEGNPDSGAAAYEMYVEWFQFESDFYASPTSLQSTLHVALKWIDDNWAVGGLTMDDMLTEMLSATPEQLTKWMGITDAYKVAVWDAPFNAEYYAALARGFKTC